MFRNHEQGDQDKGMQSTLHCKEPPPGEPWERHSGHPDGCGIQHRERRGRSPRSHQAVSKGNQGLSS